MYQSEELKTHLETSSTIKTQSLVLAEWNLNVASNILEIGNYRYRPSAGSEDQSVGVFGKPRSFFVKETAATHDKFYYGATDYDVLVDGGYDESGDPQFIQTVEERSKYLFSLEECFGRFRPRSGINKLVNGRPSFIPDYNKNSFLRPRYYPADKSNQFKYWTSFRQETVNNVVYPRGVSGNSPFWIDDTVPFVVYNNPVFTNKIVIKMQTHVGSIDEGPFISANGKSTLADPFYESGSGTKQATPKIWKVQYLSSETNQSGQYTWEDAYSFDATEPVPVDGYVELRYGVIVPETYSDDSTVPNEVKDNFLHVGTYSSITPIPELSIIGYAYLVKETPTDIGQYFVYNGGTETGANYMQNYSSFVPTYGWRPASQSISDQTPHVTELTNPDYFVEATVTQYRELQRIKGIRIVVDKMTKENASFDLIEMSPRLAVNITDMVQSYSINKVASDVGITGLPIGQLLASGGDLSIFDYNQAFNTNNAYHKTNNADGSIIADLATHNIQFKFYQIVLDVNGSNYYIPQKTMYSDGFPRTDVSTRDVNLKLRDNLFRFEQEIAPELVLINASVTYIVCCLLDAIGFSNYKFYRMDNESDDVIPYFFTSPTQTLAQTLEDLARSTQTAMFFDENNDFVLMTKEYLLPKAAVSGRGATDLTITGNANGSVLPNIAQIASTTNDVYNDGSISYNVKYIQKQNRNPNKALQTESRWVYGTTQLWSISGESVTTASNESSAGNQGSYALTATPLNANLSATAPTAALVSGNVVIYNNTIDFGENIYWQKDNRYNGYFYSNGEVIKYDAIQYTFIAPGSDITENTIWVNNLDEYKNAFAKIKFNGRMFPTGLVRIYTEVDASGNLIKHGRGQFGTKIVEHTAGLATSWSGTQFVHGINMDSSQLFKGTTTNQEVIAGPSGKKFSSKDSDAVAQNGSTRNGIIRNNLSTRAPSEKQIASMKTVGASDKGVVQSSALVFNGPSFDTTETGRDFVSYVYKDLGNPYSHVGTRMRIIGKPVYKEDDGTSQNQDAYGSMTYFSAEETGGTLPTISGGSGGISIMNNPTNNTGYFFEIAALSVDTIKDFDTSNVANVFFYKLARNSTDLSIDGSGRSIPIPLWKGLYGINVNTGNRYGDSNNANVENTSVYDLAIDWEKITVGNKTTYRFYLHINGKIVAVVDDTNALATSQTNLVSMFVRGSSQCMFENIYALKHNTAKTLGEKITPIGSVSKIFNSKDSQLTDKGFGDVYGISGIIQSTYFDGLSSSGVPDYEMYYDEFGAIMRECAHFDIKFQDAYPALMAKLVDTTSMGYRQYAVSGFRYHPYGAEFMVFNTGDAPIVLGEGTSNLLSITGVTFTSQSDNKLTVDDYFSEKSDFSSATFTSNLYDINSADSSYKSIRDSRTNYGRKEFSFSAPYIQSREAAQKLMGWIMQKLSVPRRSVGIEVFCLPIIQLGDIVEVDYDVDGVNQIALQNSRFVVYGIEIKVGQDGLTQNVYLSEVVA